jgi:ADP-ribose pyrophosphatase
MEFIEKRIDGKTIYEGIIVNVRRDRAELVNGNIVGREVVEHPGGVTVIPVEDDGTVWCVRQFRYPFRREMLETPAGKLERGEDPMLCAVRELSEETGLSADEFFDLGRCCTSPGFSTEVLHIYMARGLHHGAMHLDHNEFLNVERHSLDELTAMVMSGEIDDAKTIIAVLKAKLHLRAEQ